VEAQPVVSTPLAGGHLLAAISTSIVGILREHYGRGPMKAKTYALDDIVVVVMRGSGFTPLEQTIMDSGEPDRVIAMREDFQRVMATRYTQTIEELTTRKVLAFLSQAHVEPDITMEIFFVDGPLEGFGASRSVSRNRATKRPSRGRARKEGRPGTHDDYPRGHIGPAGPRARWPPHRRLRANEAGHARCSSCPWDLSISSQVPLQQKSAASTARTASPRLTEHPALA
jgi:uncharacterized protein YbcI